MLAKASGSMCHMVCLFTSQHRRVPNYIAWWQRHIYVRTICSESHSNAGNWSHDLQLQVQHSNNYATKPLVLGQTIAICDMRVMFFFRSVGSCTASVYSGWRRWTVVWDRWTHLCHSVWQTRWPGSSLNNNTIIFIWFILIAYENWNFKNKQKQYGVTREYRYNYTYWTSV